MESGLLTETPNVTLLVILIIGIPYLAISTFKSNSPLKA